MTSTGARISGERAVAPRAAGILWAHQLWPLHDAHHGLHLFRLLTMWMVRYGHGGKPSGRAVRLAVSTGWRAAVDGFESNILS